MDSDFSTGGASGDVSYDLAPFFSGAVGYDFGQFRAELEGAYSSIGGDKISVDGVGSAGLGGAEADIITVTANAFYDFDTGTSFSPYLGGGAGAAFTDVDDFTVGGVTVQGNEDTSLTAFGEIGLGIAVTDSVTISPAYRFLWINDGDNGVDDSKAHILKVGARLAF